MPNLLKLPRELLATISEFMDHPDIGNMCLVSQELNRVFQPIFFTAYSDLDSAAGWFWKESDMTGDIRLGVAMKRSLVRFICSVLQHEDLASRLKHVHVRYNKTSEWGTFPGIPVAHPSKWELDVLTKGVEEVPSSSAMWLAGVQDFQREDVVALLAYHAPNLETLLLHRSCHVRIMEILSSPQKSQASQCSLPLLRLKNLNLGSTVWVDLTTIVPILLLPSLEKFAAKRCGGDRESMPNHDATYEWLPRKEVNIRDLSLTDCSMDRNILNTMIAACRTLDAFIYGVTYQRGGLVERVIAGFECHRESLRKLEFDFRLSNPIQDEEALCDLTGFPKLEEISLDYSFSNYDSLPTALQRLTITFQYWPEIVNRLKQLRALTRERHQDLISITFKVVGALWTEFHAFGPLEEDPAELRDLVQNFESQNILLLVEPYHHNSPFCLTEELVAQSQRFTSADYDSYPQCILRCMK